MSTDRNALIKRRVHALFITFVSIAGCMFIFKLFSFMKTVKRDELAGFAFDPIFVYGLVALGFLLLLAWAWMTGQLRNIESPKYEMLERFEAQEHAERLALESKSHE